MANENTVFKFDISEPQPILFKDTAKDAFHMHVNSFLTLSTQDQKTPPKKTKSTPANAGVPKQYSKDRLSVMVELNPTKHSKS